MRKIVFFILVLCNQFVSDAQSVPSIVGSGKTVDPYKYAIVKKGEFSKCAVSSAHSS